MKASGWAFDRSKEAFETVAQDEKEKVILVPEIMLQNHGLLAANHCTRRRTMRSHNVLFVPELQQFPTGRLRLVGLWRKTYQVVLRNVWKEVRLEATKQAFSLANR